MVPFGKMTDRMTDRFDVNDEVSPLYACAVLIVPHRLPREPRLVGSEAAGSG